MLDMLERAESFVQQSETATKNDTRKMNPESAVGSQEVLLGECLTGKFTERSSHHRVLLLFPMVLISTSSSALFSSSLESHIFNAKQILL